MKKFIQFYAYDNQHVRRIFSFKVENYNDAINALRRMKQPSGWYVERTKYGQVTKNEFIKL